MPNSIDWCAKGQWNRREFSYILKNIDFYFIVCRTNELSLEVVNEDFVLRIWSKCSKGDIWIRKLFARSNIFGVHLRQKISGYWPVYSSFEYHLKCFLARVRMKIETNRRRRWQSCLRTNFPHFNLIQLFNARICSLFCGKLQVFTCIE